jgi:hypothetical protein
MADPYRNALFAALDDDDEWLYGVDSSRGQFAQALDRATGIDVPRAKEDDANDRRLSSHCGSPEIRVVSHDDAFLARGEFEHSGVGDSGEPLFDHGRDIDAERPEVRDDYRSDVFIREVSKRREIQPAILVEITISFFNISEA